VKTGDPGQKKKIQAENYIEPRKLNIEYQETEKKFFIRVTWRHPSEIERIRE
jgi:hypothetical protein